MFLSFYTSPTTGSDQTASMVMTPPKQTKQGLDDGFDDVTTEYEL